MKDVVAVVFRRSGRHQACSLLLAAMFVGMTILQLFSFEDMPGVLQVLLPSDWTFNANALMALIVAMEVFAIPYFLPIALSPLARLSAGVFAVIVPLAWLGLNLYAVAAGQAANAGFLSPKVPLDASLLSIVALLVLLVGVIGLMLRDRRSHS